MPIILYQCHKINEKDDQIWAWVLGQKLHYTLIIFGKGA